MPQGWMATRIPALIFDGIVEIGCLFFLYFGGRGRAMSLRRHSVYVVRASCNTSELIEIDAIKTRSAIKSL